MVTSLFETLARRASVSRQRREWVAQGLFVHAVEANTNVQELIRSTLKVSSDSVLAGVEEEEDREYWRSDVLIKWQGASPTKVELKLNAGLTPGQKQALREGDINLLVAPQAWLAEYHKGDFYKTIEPPPDLSWKRLAECSGTDLALSELLDQAECARGSLSTLTWNAVFEDFKGDRLDLREFLTTIDEWLEETLGISYEAEAGWSRKPAYVGYNFAWQSKDRANRHSYWIGFYQSDLRPRLELWRYPEELQVAAERLPAFCRDPLDASSIVETLAIFLALESSG